MDVLKFSVKLETTRYPQRSSNCGQTVGLVVDDENGWVLRVPEFAICRVIGAARAAAKHGRHPYEAARTAMDRVLLARQLGRLAADAAATAIDRGFKFTDAYEIALRGVPSETAKEHAFDLLYRWGYLDGPPRPKKGSAAEGAVWRKERCETCGGVNRCPVLYYEDVITTPNPQLWRKNGSRKVRYNVSPDLIPPGYTEELVDEIQSWRIKAHWPNVKPRHSHSSTDVLSVVLVKKKPGR